MTAVAKIQKASACREIPPSDTSPSTTSPTSSLPPTQMLVQNTAQDISALFDMGHEIGRGQYGVIRVCSDKASGRRYACKSIDKRKLSELGREEVVKEVKIMRMLSGHPAVVELNGVYEDHKVRTRSTLLSPPFGSSLTPSAIP